MLMFFRTLLPQQSSRLSLGCTKMELPPWLVINPPTPGSWRLVHSAWPLTHPLLHVCPRSPNPPHSKASSPRSWVREPGNCWWALASSRVSWGTGVRMQLPPAEPKDFLSGHPARGPAAGEATPLLLPVPGRKGVTILRLHDHSLLNPIGP